MKDIDNYIYKYNEEFDVNNFYNYVLKTKKSTSELKKILKLELVNNFYNKIN